MMEDQIAQIAGLLQQATNSLNQLRQQPPASNRQRPVPAQAAANQQEASQMATNQQQPGPSQAATNQRHAQEPGPSRGIQNGSAIMRYRNIFRQQQSTRSRSRSTDTSTRGNPSPMGLQRQRPTRRRTFSRKVVCLANRDDCKVPMFEEKALLKRCGLGEKAISFLADGDISEVEDALLKSFPQLEKAGGFELLRPGDRSRTTLSVVSVGACCAEDIKSFCSDRFYIRPIQCNLDLEENEPSMLACERCHRCEMNIPLHLLRDHVDECLENADTRDNEGNDEQELPEVSIEPEVAMEPVQAEQELPEVSVEPKVAMEPAQTKGLIEVKVEEAISKVKQEIGGVDTRPEDCLAKFCGAFMEGRMLDPQSHQQEEPEEGETYNIFVSRKSVLEDVVAEVIHAAFKPYLPLCVEFFGEDAVDFGGPRKELLRMALERLVGRVFVEERDGVRLGQNPAHMENMFKGAGIIVGLCLLQGGPSPAIFTPSFVESIVQGNELDRQTEMFSSGLRTTGILQLIHAFPQCKQLLVATAIRKLTVARFIALFNKELADDGSNRRQREEATLSTFVRYLREVAADRRVVKLGDILQFTTGLRQPPPMGFIPKPTIVFDPSPSFLPRAATCPNTLILPIATLGNSTPPVEKIYEMFDYGFKNEYFGNP
ncbi:G2/M phase-specific E3 ubiquitin-protein ligase [Holothuria leucospilota]|uniref:HECT-type E3 ubiquitin transferase n=1 Tax=Holothuria leucospilota TaxID=206669 RepID=A0A9Q1CQW5_HOLLE|nr:G2/M phase-specific E3 ubiquitin-protein ligase [Holothuria leucospilota]